MEEVTKLKNPGRVAAGKRTAELNRKRKEDLLRNQKTVPSDAGSGAEEVPRGLELSGRALCGGGAVAILLVGAGFALYFYRGKKKPLPAAHSLESSNGEIFCMR